MTEFVILGATGHFAMIPEHKGAILLVSALLVFRCGGKMKGYRTESIGWPCLFNSRAPILAATGPSACYRPQQGIEASAESPSPSKR